MKNVQDMTIREKDALKDVFYQILQTDMHPMLSVNFDKPNPNRDFYLQYTNLSWDEDEKEWKLTCCIDTPEMIYDPDVLYSEDDMSVKLKSWKNNWDSFYFCNEKERNEDDIPLYELYPDFESSEYVGKCWMR